MASAEYLKVSGTKRFIIEDSITKVTSDGEPHETMTMIAVISGLLTAIVILMILVSLVGCRKQSDNEEDKSDSGSTVRTMVTRTSSNESGVASARSSILTIYQPHRYSINYEMKNECSCGKSMLKRNLEGNLNAAFMSGSSELHMKDKNGVKAKKRAHWSDEIPEKTKTNSEVCKINEETI